MWWMPSSLTSRQLPVLLLEVWDWRDQLGREKYPLRRQRHLTCLLCFLQVHPSNLFLVNYLPLCLPKESGSLSALCRFSQSYLKREISVLGRARRSWDGLMESCTCYRGGPPDHHHPPARLTPSPHRADSPPLCHVTKRTCFFGGHRRAVSFVG